MLGTLAVVVLVIGACAGETSDTTGTSTLSTTATTTTETTMGAVTTIIGSGEVTVTEWDYFAGDPQNGAWGELLASCAEATGYAIDRQALPRDELIQQVLLGAQQGQLPGILVVDNPDLQQLASTDALVPLTDFGVSTDGLYPAVLDAGTYEDEVYGVAPGINGMALFYNVDLLEEAGVEPPTTWTELSEAAAALTAGDVYGMAFSAPANEEGTWQFLPWFWGAGADLTQLDSPEAVAALEFWVDLVQSGSASQSVVQWGQGDVNDQFMAGVAAIQQNGVWNLGALDESGINYGIVPIPQPQGGAAPGPMGGEVLTIPVTDEDTQAAAGEVVNCLLEDDSMSQWAALQAYIPSRESVAQQAAEATPNMAAFVEAAGSSRSRPGPPANLGPRYGEVSQALWTAVQAALSGASTAQDALTEAQAQVGQ
jgi:multiple sugar transport system substrate-binding protein